MRKARRVLVAGAFLLVGWYAANQRVLGDGLDNLETYDVGKGPSYGMLEIKFRIVPYRIG